LLWLLALIHSTRFSPSKGVRDEFPKIRGLFPSGKVRIVQFRGQEKRPGKAAIAMSIWDRSARLGCQNWQYLESTLSL